MPTTTPSIFPFAQLERNCTSQQLHSISICECENILLYPTVHDAVVLLNQKPEMCSESSGTGSEPKLTESDNSGFKINENREDSGIVIFTNTSFITEENKN